VPQNPNKPAKIEAAFFDVDNTLIRGSSSFLFGKAAFRKKFFKDRALGLIAGHRVEELSSMTEMVYDDYISPKLWPEVVRIAKQHIAEGREVWLVTATPIEIAEIMAHKLGLTGGLGTLVERKDGILTGQLAASPCTARRRQRPFGRLPRSATSA
jgi:phosphoserine phosphatase